MTSWKSILKILLIFSLKPISFNQNLTNDLSSTFREPRITGGYRPTGLHLEKYIVSLRLRGETLNSFGYTHFCAGSIIGINKILTAAHCFIRKDVRNYMYKVVAKTPNRLHKILKTEELLVKKIILHSYFNDDMFSHDIALLILEKNIDLDSKSAAVIPLPREDIKPGSICQSIGWGRIYRNGPLANEVLHVELHLHARSFCMKYKHSSNKKICASNFHDREKDVCSGDSGGPLICDGILAGIVSYGFGCASGHPSFYTNVFKYIDWIHAGGQNVLKPSLFIFLMVFVHA